MAVQSLDSFPPITPAELRRRLEAAGFDTTRVDALGRDLRLDLIELLAGWAPTLADLMHPPRRRSWWQRFLDWRAS